MQTVKKALVGALAVSAVATGPVLAQSATVGFLGGFTGQIESLTPPIFSAAELAVSHVNDQGGLLDGELAIESADTTCGDATAASNAADQLVNTTQVTAIVGALCSGATISAANNAAIPGNVVMISPASTSPALTEMEDNDLVFRTAPSDAYQGDQLAQLVLDKGIEDVAVTYVNNDYGAGLADAFAAAFEANGGTVLANEAHEDGKADYRAELGALAGTGGQNLVIIAYANGSGQTIVRQAVESGDFTTFIGADGMVGDELFTGVDPSMVEGMIATKPGTPDLPGSEVYSGLAEDAGLDATAVFAPQSYDAAFLLALAIEKNGSADREGLAQALRDVATEPGEAILPGEWEKAKGLIAEGTEINYEGASGAHEFDDAGDVPGTIIEMTVEDGAFVEVGRVNY